MRGSARPLRHPARVAQILSPQKMFLLCSHLLTRLPAMARSNAAHKRPPEKRSCPPRRRAPMIPKTMAPTPMTTSANCSAWRSISSAAAAAARSRTPLAATSRWRGLPSTTAGAVSMNCRRSRRRLLSTLPARSSPATTRPTSASTARSIPIAAASTAASIALRARPTPISACRPGSISNPSCWSSRKPPSCLNANCRRRITSRR